MKKMTTHALLGLALTLCLTGCASTSIGIGAVYSQTGSSVHTKEHGTIQSDEQDVGPSLFFDMKYMEAVAAFYRTALTNSAFAAPESHFSGWSAGLYAKAPLTFWRITLFPFAGLEYAWYLDYTLDKSASAPAITTKDYNALWLKAGLGFDFLFGKRFFLRGEALYGFRLANQYEKAVAEAEWVLPGHLAQGFTFKAAFGWKLGKQSAQEIEAPPLFTPKDAQGTFPAGFDGKWNGPGNEQFIFTGKNYTTNAIRGQVERGTFTYTIGAGGSGSITFQREAGMYNNEWIKDAYAALTIDYSYANERLILYGDSEIALER
ncbi:MAG: hypothetical protein LBS86_02200 [Treponema sp.]|jgi:hypothetical protein|nr:hypothetical protein [Treponema sp.]